MIILNEGNHNGGNDPGAVRYGNFINYYSFHSPESRISCLPFNLLKCAPDEAFVCLDIGCNSGELTIATHEAIQNTLKCNQCCILGIDIDPMLILRARENNKRPENIRYDCLNIMNNFLPEIDNYLRDFKKEKFNVVFLFSVTMWIHLNYGDDGLKTLIKKVCNMTNILVIEPQPWKCYKTAERRLKKKEFNFSELGNIKMRQTIIDDIKSLISSFNFVKIYESSNSWKRPMLIYQKA